MNHYPLAAFQAASAMMRGDDSTPPRNVGARHGLPRLTRPTTLGGKSKMASHVSCLGSHSGMVVRAGAARPANAPMATLALASGLGPDFLLGFLLPHLSDPRADRAGR